MNLTVSSYDWHEFFPNGKLVTIWFSFYFFEKWFSFYYFCGWRFNQRASDYIQLLIILVLLSLSGLQSFWYVTRFSL